MAKGKSGKQESVRSPSIPELSLDGTDTKVGKILVHNPTKTISKVVANVRYICTEH